MIQSLILHGRRKCRKLFIEGLFFGALLAFTTSVAVFTLSHWWYSDPLRRKPSFRREMLCSEESPPRTETLKRWYVPASIKVTNTNF